MAESGKRGQGAEIAEWKVFFEGDFWGHHAKDHAGEEIAVGKEFEWGGNLWYIPAVYSCAKGLVIDLCMRVEPERIRAFIDKWNLDEENDDIENFSSEQQLMLEAENPLSFDFCVSASVNGRTLLNTQKCEVTFNPCLPQEGGGREAERVIARYRLDPACGWMIARAAFPWAAKRRPKIDALSVSMEQQKVATPGPRFSVNAPGDRFAFDDPLTGQTYTLTVQEYERQTLDVPGMRKRDMDDPTCYTAMTYTITPPLPDDALTVTDCAPGDRPRPRQEGRCLGAEGTDAANIIGGADGPVSIFLCGKGRGALRAASSALHFAPVDEVEWRITFHHKPVEDIRVALL